ncbi:MAG: transposase [SAR324 cluster bacterium]|nr:transposase [SAR324 cluster bacterium]
MIATTFEEVHSEEWVATYISDPTNELVIFRLIIPWAEIIKHLGVFYHSSKGAMGKSIRMMTAILLLSRLRSLSDRKVIAFIKENPYMQYFCNVPPENLHTFLHPSSLCVFRSRLGVKGIDIIESIGFQQLRKAGAIENDAALIDSSVLENNIIYPNDVRLIFSAFKKMNLWAKNSEVPLWWKQQEIKKLWREYSMDKKASRRLYLIRFYLLFSPVLEQFKKQAQESDILVRAQAEYLIGLLSLLEEQTLEKMKGTIHIENRLVSLDELDARPIKKGKAFPNCEFGTTNEMIFNRQGFMVTNEILIGHPSDKTLYQSSLDLYIDRMKAVPETSVTDGNYRSAKNLKYRPDGLRYVFLGRSTDVPESKREFCQKARSATEGFIAVAKNIRGFKKSLYRRLKGDKIWATLCQMTYNLKKFLQLYREEAYDESVLIKLGLLD